MRSVLRRIASTATRVELCTASICSAICSVALAVCTASDLTSDATTAKPRPASPALAASIVALSARRLVCPAMLRIKLTTSPISWTVSVSRVICSFVVCASTTECDATSAAWLIWRPISLIEAINSSAALAAAIIFDDASLEACTAPAVRSEVEPDESDNVTAIDLSAAVLADTVCNTAATFSRNARISVSISTRRRSCSVSAALFLSA